MSHDSASGKVSYCGLRTITNTVQLYSFLCFEINFVKKIYPKALKLLGFMYRILKDVNNKNILKNFYCSLVKSPHLSTLALYGRPTTRYPEMAILIPRNWFHLLD